jgi:hypothetical protein
VTCPIYSMIQTSSSHADLGLVAHHSSQQVTGIYQTVSNRNWNNSQFLKMSTIQSL